MIMGATFLTVRMLKGMITFACLYDIVLVTRNTYDCYNLNNYQIEIF